MCPLSNYCRQLNVNAWKNDLGWFWFGFDDI